MSLTQELKKQSFEALWAKYPNKDGKKQAWTHYNRSIKTYQDIEEITAALNNYISHLKQEDWKKPKNGSTWFNNYQDWIKVFTPNELINPLRSKGLTPEEIEDTRIRFSPEYQRALYRKICNLWTKSKKLKRITALNNAPGNMW